MVEPGELPCSCGLNNFIASVEDKTIVDMLELLEKFQDQIIGARLGGVRDAVAQIKEHHNLKQ